MEPCPISLKDYAKTNDINVEMAMGIFYQILNGYFQIYEAKLIHRNLKLSNILIGLDGECKIADLGLAKPVKNHE